MQIRSMEQVRIHFVKFRNLDSIIPYENDLLI